MSLFTDRVWMGILRLINKCMNMMVGGLLYRGMWMSIWSILLNKMRLHVR